MPGAASSKDAPYHCLPFPRLMSFWHVFCALFPDFQTRNMLGPDDGNHSGADPHLGYPDSQLHGDA